MGLGIMVRGMAPIDMQHQLAHGLAQLSQLVTLLGLTQGLFPISHLAALRCSTIMLTQSDVDVIVAAGLVRLTD